MERDGYDNPDVKIFFTEEVKKESSPLPLLHPFILCLFLRSLSLSSFFLVYLYFSLSPFLLYLIIKDVDPSDNTRGKSFYSTVSEFISQHFFPQYVKIVSWTELLERN